MFQRFHENRENEKGFTLIELLVVILIIAILAAIAIPVFLSQREKGWQSQLESALKNASTAVESHATDNNGSYAGVNGLTGAPGSTLYDDEGYRGAAAVTVTVDSTAAAYCIEGVHTDLAGVTMAVSSEDSEPTEDTCTGGVKTP